MTTEDYMILFRMAAITLGGVVLILAVSRGLREHRKSKPQPRVEWPDNVVEFRKQEFLEKQSEYRAIHRPSRRIH